MSVCRWCRPQCPPPIARARRCPPGCPAVTTRRRRAVACMRMYVSAMQCECMSVCPARKVLSTRGTGRNTTLNSGTGPGAGCEPACFRQRDPGYSPYHCNDPPRVEAWRSAYTAAHGTYGIYSQCSQFQFVVALGHTGFGYRDKQCRRDGMMCNRINGTSRNDYDDDQMNGCIVSHTRNHSGLHIHSDQKPRDILNQTGIHPHPGPGTTNDGDQCLQREFSIHTPRSTDQCITADTNWITGDAMQIFCMSPRVNNSTGCEWLERTSCDRQANDHGESQTIWYTLDAQHEQKHSHSGSASSLHSSSLSVHGRSDTGQQHGIMGHSSQCQQHNHGDSHMMSDTYDASPRHERTSFDGNSPHFSGPSVHDNDGNGNYRVQCGRTLVRRCVKC